MVWTQKAREASLRTRSKPLLERFWEKVVKTDGCWGWLGAPSRDGYGRISRGKQTEGKVLAHRLSWELHYGPIPEGFEVCHQCDTPSCVRPDHLFLGTHADNQKDMACKGRRPWGEKHEFVKLTTAQVREIRKIWAERDVRLDSAGRALHGESITTTSLGKQFVVGESTIRDILKGRTRIHE